MFSSDLVVLSLLENSDVEGAYSLFKREDSSVFMLCQTLISCAFNITYVYIFDKNFWIFSKIFLNFSIFMIPYKSREIPVEFYYQVEKFIKNLNK